MPRKFERAAPITACADLPPPAALTLDRTYSSTLRTEGLKILEQIEPQSLAALKSERTRLLAPSERGLAVAAAAALLALTRSRRPVGVALGLFAAVRELSADRVPERKLWPKGGVGGRSLSEKNDYFGAVFSQIYQQFSA